MGWLYQPHRQRLQPEIRVAFICIRVKQRLTVFFHAKFSDHLLRFDTRDEFGKRHRALIVDTSPLIRIDRDDVIDIQQRIVALQEDFQLEVSFISEIGGAVGQDVGALFRSTMRDAPIPCPVSMYQGCPAGSILAFFQKSSSFLCVPESSPRETKDAPLL